MSGTTGAAMDRESFVEVANAGPANRRDMALASIILLVTILSIGYMYARVLSIMQGAWNAPDSLYSHGILIPFICLYFVWKKRVELFQSPIYPSGWGFVWIAGALFIHLSTGEFLGFHVAGQLSFVALIVGLVFVYLGRNGARLMAFPLFFLLFMVPIPSSITSSIALKMKLFAAEGAVLLCNGLTLPMVRNGSFIHFVNSQGVSDQLIVGEVCGGLRSLIALLATGVLMAYISKTSNVGKVIIVLMSPPIAVIANVLRIFLLCVVGYFYGSDVAAGKVHDISGWGIFIVAFGLFFALEGQLRRFLPPNEDEPVEVESEVKKPERAKLRVYPLHYGVALGLILLGALGHSAIVMMQAGAEVRPMNEVLDVPRSIGGYTQVGPDEDIPENVKAALETSTILIRNYESFNKWPIQLSIVYAGTTRRSLHFPEVCLVGAGMEIRQQYETMVGFEFSAKRLVLVQGKNQFAVLYFFKTVDQ